MRALGEVVRIEFTKQVLEDNREGVLPIRAEEEQ